MDVVIVTINGIDVASFVNAYIHKLVAITDLVVGIVEHNMVGEGFATISGNCHPYSVVAAGASLAAGYLACIMDATEGLVDDVADRIDHQVPDHVVVDKEGMAGIDGTRYSCTGEECLSSVGATVDVDVKCRNIVVGDTDPGCPIGGNPFTISPEMVAASGLSVQVLPLFVLVLTST